MREARRVEFQPLGGEFLKCDPLCRAHGIVIDLVNDGIHAVVTAVREMGMAQENDLVTRDTVMLIDVFHHEVIVEQCNPRAQLFEKFTLKRVTPGLTELHGSAERAHARHPAGVITDFRQEQGVILPDQGHCLDRYGTGRAPDRHAPLLLNS